MSRGGVCPGGIMSVSRVGPVITGPELTPREGSLEKDFVIYVRETVMKPASVGSMVGAEGGRKDITHRETRSV